MKRIFNWTFGACFRTIGRLLAIFLVGVLLIFIGSKLGFKLDSILPIKVNAATISTSGNQFNMYYSSNPEACIDTVGYGYKNLDTSIHVSGISGNDYGTIKRIDYISNANLSANTNYTLTLIQSYNPKNFDMFTEDPWKFNIEGSTTTSSSNLSADNILSYSCNVTNINNKYQVRIVCNFTPKNSIKKLWLSINTNCHTFGVDYFNTYNLNIESNNETSNAINNQTEVIIDKSDKIINEQNKTNETLNDDNVDESLSQADNFFNGFTTNTHGLTGIITAPLNAIQSLTSKTCSPLILPIPFVDKDLTLPCMRQIYTDNFGSFMNLYDVIVIGIVSYWVLVRIFTLVKDFKNPDHDEIEVVDL